jgi:membrane protease YdiL (CAAX protease family)
MITRERAIAARSRDGLWALAPAGFTLLLIRPLFAFGPAGIWLLAACYLAVGTASIQALGVASVQAVRTDPSSPPSGSRDGSLVVLAGALVVGAFVASARQRGLPTALGPVGLGLTALASLAEEAFFRGFLYGRLVRHGPLLAIVGSAGAFALIHVLGYPPAAVAVDFAAGLMFGWQRWVTGGWLVPASTHLMANLMVVMA